MFTHEPTNHSLPRHCLDVVTSQTYRLPGKQRVDAEPLFRQVSVRLRAVPVGELKGQQVSAEVRADGLGEQQSQTVVT